MSATTPYGITVGFRDRPADVAADEPVRIGWRLPPGAETGGSTVRVTPIGGAGLSVEATEQHVTLPAGTLLPGARYTVEIDTVAGRSEPSWFGTAPVDEWDHADPVWADPGEPWAFLRHEVELAEPPAWASLFVTAWSGEPSRQYVHRTWCNGMIVGVGPPRAIAGETRFDGYDVTGLLRPGTNAIAAQAWAAEGRAYQALLAIGHADGRVEWHGTSERWRARSGEAPLPEAGSIGTHFFTAPVEDLDLRAYPSGFTTPGHDDSEWGPATVRPRASELRPTPATKPAHQLREPVAVDEVEPGSYRIDYGRSWIGGLELSLPGDAGRRIGLGFGEQRDASGAARTGLTTGNTYRDTWTCADRPTTASTWGMRVFRYADVTGAPSGWGAADLPALAQVTPLGDPEGSFDCSDPELNAVWRLCRDSIESLDHQLAVDSWTREREPYEADLYIQTLAHLAVSADPSVMAYTLDYLLRRRTWPTEWPWYLVLTAEELYLRTGDLDGLASRYDALAATLPLDWIDPATGLITKPTGSDGSASRDDHDLVDWPPGERDDHVFAPVNTVINAIGCAAIAALARISGFLGRDADARRWSRLAASCAAAIQDQLWDTEAEAFRDGIAADGPVAHHSQHSGVFTTGLGLATPEQAERVAADLVSRGLAVSVYASGFALRTLFATGRDREAIAMITGPGVRSWRHMIEIGAGATMEAWDPALKPNLTFSHPWGAWPAHLLTEHVLGVRPVTAGWGTVRIRPALGDLDWAEGVVPTVRGPIHVRADRDPDAPGGVRVAAEVPGGVRVEPWPPR